MVVYMEPLGKPWVEAAKTSHAGSAWSYNDYKCPNSRDVLVFEASLQGPFNVSIRILSRAL